MTSPLTTVRSLRTQLLIAVVILLALFLTMNAHAQSSLHTFLTRHVPQAVANGTAKAVGPFSTTQSMHLEVVLPLRNQSGLNTLLSKLYNPTSPEYHHFLTVAQFTSQFGPTVGDYQSVVEWAKTNGFTVGKTPANRLLVPITGTVSQVNKAFNITMTQYQTPTRNRIFHSPDREPRVNLSIPLWHVAGLNNYSIPHPALAHRTASTGSGTATTGSGPDDSFLGSDMRAAYYGGTALTGSGQSVGLLEYHGTDLSDLNAYFSNVGQTNNVPIDLYSTDGTSTSCLESDGCDDTEQTLDMTQVLGMAPGISRLVVYIGNTDAAILNAMAAGYDGTLDYSLSSSWTWIPSSPDANDPIFKEFAAQGQSFFQAAGDWGTWTTTLYDEYEVYPADDPHVISVGGTDLETTGSGGSWSSETTWEGTGGGISPAPDQFSIPSWQTSTAQNCTYCSQSYRNGPDVAANADYTFYVCADQGSNPYFDGEECGANIYGGTSFAAPMWAGYIALVNQKALEDGENRVGFIDQALYSFGSGSGDFHDITNGCDNTYCATTGYDLVTGLGSPNGQNLIDALAEYATPQAATPYSSSSYSTTGGTDPTIVFTETLYDSTPGAEIYWTVPGCAGQINGSSPVSSGGSFTLTYEVPVDCNPSGTMYATAPGYSQSSTTSIEF